jgi:hypothetical protein
MVPARAEFKVTNPAPTMTPLVLVCGVLAVQPRDNNDKAPICMIALRFNFDDRDESHEGKLSGLDIRHISVFGASYIRADQYSNDYLAQTPGKVEITWRGSLKKNRQVKMVGRVWIESDSGHWFYSEVVTGGSGFVNMKRR